MNVKSFLSSYKANPKSAVFQPGQPNPLNQNNQIQAAPAQKMNVQQFLQAYKSNPNQFKKKTTPNSFSSSMTQSPNVAQLPQNNNTKFPGNPVADVAANIVGEGVGAAKTIASQIQPIGNAILTPFKAAMNKVGIKTPTTGIPDADLQAKTQAEALGGKITGGAELVDAAQGVATGALDIADSLSKGGSIWDATKNLASKIFVGKEGTATLKELKNADAMKFVPEAAGGAGKTFDEVVDNVNGAVDKFVSDSKKALQSVKNKIPYVKIDPAEISTRVNQGIMKSVENNAAYKGVEGAAEGLFKTPEDLINSGLLNDSEAKTVNGIVKTISKWGDNSARGVLNLKEQLNSFYRGAEDSRNADAILSKIQDSLKDLVGEYAPKLKGALSVATDNIEKADQFAKTLTGKDAIQGESKLVSIARNLKNPAAGGEKLGLLDDLKKATGYDAMPELKGYADYLKLLEKNFPTQMETILKNVATRTGIAGGITAAGVEVKNLFGL